VSIPDQSAVLVAFARAAAKAQEIEAIFKDLLLAAEVAQDTRNRSLEEMSAMIEKQTLGSLKQKFLEIAQQTVRDPKHSQMWKDINEERIFLMHTFFNAFGVVSRGEGIVEASQRLEKIDRLLDIGYRMLRELRERTFASFNIPQDKLREFLAFVVEKRKTAFPAVQ
jgi:hypothetical protein